MPRSLSCLNSTTEGPLDRLQFTIGAAHRVCLDACQFSPGFGSLGPIAVRPFAINFPLLSKAINSRWPRHVVEPAKVLTYQGHRTDLAIVYFLPSLCREQSIIFQFRVPD